MTTSPHSPLFPATWWRLTLLNAAVLCALLLAITAFLYLVEVATTDAEMNRLLAQTVQQERGEDLVARLKSQETVIDPPRPFNPAPLQAFFLLVDTQGRVHEGTAYLLQGLPDRAAFQQVLATGTADLRESTVDGFHLRLSTVAIFDQTGRPAGVIQVYVSLEGRDRELERLLSVLLTSCVLGIVLSVLAAGFLAHRALLPIRRAFEQQEQFVADASHELRAPLTLLQADLEVLKRALGLTSFSIYPMRHGGSEDQEAVLSLNLADVEVMDEMAAEIGHMSTLMTDLLTLARYDAGVHPSDRQTVALASLLSSIADRLTSQIAQAHLTLYLLLPDTADQLAVDGDPAALRRLFLALLHNAITYTPAGGKIWLQADQVGGNRVAISVRDTGRGIAATDLPHLFTRFYRVDKARTPRASTTEEQGAGGTGLGLSIAQAIVERHGGTITASSPGQEQGSTFTVLLKGV